MSEILSVFDADYNPSGTAEREEVHTKGLWHETVHFWIAGEIDGEKSIVAQKRSRTAETYPDKLDITAAGHLLHGESPTDFREVVEEIGLLPEEIYYIGTTKDSTRDGEILDNQFNHTYLARVDKSPEVYDPEENIQAFVVIKLDDFYNIWEKGSKVRATSYSDQGSESVLVSARDFVERDDSYYSEIASLSYEMFENRGGLALRKGRFFLRAAP